MTREELYNTQSSWIHPDGTIQHVDSECHDYDLPTFCENEEDAENVCVRVSCNWGYSAPISEIFLPVKLTIYQAQKLVDINESLKEYFGINIEKKICEWHNGLSWKEILDNI